MDLSGVKCMAYCLTESLDGNAMRLIDGIDDNCRHPNNLALCLQVPSTRVVCQHNHNKISV